MIIPFLKNVLYTGSIIITIGISSFSLKKVFEIKETKSVKEGFAILELFTSQGCSSCPPADALLGKYLAQNNPKIIPLAFHVDYWNRLGWNDPFSKSEFTARQSNYVRQLNAQGNYTPQIVINGKHELVGSNYNEIENFVNEELNIKPKFNIIIREATAKNNQLNVVFDAESNSNIVVNLALVKKKEFTSIKRGENSGLKQTSYNIVFDFITLSKYSKTNNLESFKFNSDKIPSDYLVVAYLQNSITGAIVGATKSEIK